MPLFSGQVVVLLFSFLIVVWLFTCCKQNEKSFFHSDFSNLWSPRCYIMGHLYIFSSFDMYKTLHTHFEITNMLDCFTVCQFICKCSHFLRISILLTGTNWGLGFTSKNDYAIPSVACIFYYYSFLIMSFISYTFLHELYIKDAIHCSDHKTTWTSLV